MMISLATVILVLLGLLSGCGEGSKNTYRSVDPTYSAERNQMVDEQIASRGIKDTAVIAAMGHVPRHQFVPPAYTHMAYADSPLPIGYGQTISQPYVVAFMTESLALKGHEKILEIGTGSGYQAAVLAEIVPQVFSIEIIEPLAQQAVKTLAELGYKNVHVRRGDGYQGWPEEAPFDAIIVTAAPDHVPQPLLDQLAIGGRMILPVGDFFQKLVLYRRTNDGYEQTDLGLVRFVPLTREDRAPRPGDR